MNYDETEAEFTPAMRWPYCWGKLSFGFII